ncbi:hypothetical protein QYE76_047036 [Lolium multiflorum]|uniref:CCHC-type domain-containing protein n=1 Tax=Lolium multiflorum TaxID=4521 RepID=A0AAD8TQP8_LOLMU|nr:hypothetical protein QYE76_047036 [Lolium multiflorum]
MERDWRRGKRPFEGGSGGDGRRRDQDLRQHLDMEQEEHRRQQRDWDELEQWRREEYRHDRELPPPPPPNSRGCEPSRGAVQRKARPPRAPRGAEAPAGMSARKPEGSMAVPSGQETALIICYKCGQPGHFQADCTWNPFCVNCNKEGHLSTMCAIFAKLQDPFWAGFVGDGRGFFCLEVPAEELQQSACNAVLVCLNSGILSAEQVEAEFTDFVEDDWEWQVSKLTDTDFALVFPSKESLRMAIRGGGLTLPSSGCRALVVLNSGDPAAVEQLVPVRIKLHDIPPPYLFSDRLLVGARDLGRPLEVDEESLAIPSDPVRIRVGCRTPIQLPSHIMMFVNLQGYRVRVEREDGPEGGQASLPPPPPHKPIEDEDEDAGESEDNRWDGRRGNHATKFKQGNLPKAKGAGGNQCRKLVAIEGPIGTKIGVGAGASAGLPPTMFSQYGSNLTVDGGMFPIMAQVLGGRTEPVAATNEVIVVSEHPTQSLSTMEVSTPGGTHAIGQSSMTNQSEEEGLVEDCDTWESNPEAMRAKERRSKSNADRPSLMHNPECFSVATQLDFTDESGAKPTSQVDA